MKVRKSAAEAAAASALVMEKLNESGNGCEDVEGPTQEDEDAISYRSGSDYIASLLRIGLAK